MRFLLLIIISKKLQKIKNLKKKKGQKRKEKGSISIIILLLSMFSCSCFICTPFLLFYRDVDKRIVSLPEIRETGEYVAELKLHPEVTARVRLNVYAN